MSILATEDDAPQLEPAGFWVRAAARVIDWLVMMAVNYAVLFALAFLGGIVAAVMGQSSHGFSAGLQKLTWIGKLGNALALLSYHTAFESIAGSTLGKRIIGLQVLSVDLAPIRFSQAVKRSLAFLIDALFFALVAAGHMNNSPIKQRVGDAWADTRVVYSNSLPQALLTPASRMIGGFAAAVVAGGMISAVAQIADAF